MAASLPEMKLVLLGSTNTGKSAFFYQLIGKDYPNPESTIGANYAAHELTTVVYHLWDVAGRLNYQSLIPLYTRNANVCCLFYNPNQAESMDYAREQFEKLKKEKETGLEIFLISSQKKDATITTEPAKLEAKERQLLALDEKETADCTLTFSCEDNTFEDIEPMRALIDSRALVISKDSPEEVTSDSKIAAKPMVPFYQHPIFIGAVVGLAVGALVTGLVAANVLTFGVPLFVTLGSALALNASGVGIGVGISTGFALLGAGVGAAYGFFTQEKDKEERLGSETGLSLAHSTQ